MSNTHNRRKIKKYVHNAAKKQDLLPLSPDSALSKQSTVCATVQLYLAVWNDLTPEQRRLVSNHLHQCEQCAHEQHLFRGVTRLIAHLPETQPSAQVDRAVFDAIAANTRIHRRTQKNKQLVTSLRRQVRILPHSSPYLRRRFIGVTTLLVLVLLALVYLWVSGNLTPETVQHLFDRLHGWLQLMREWMR